jgi:hypothetical protein
MDSVVLTMEPIMTSDAAVFRLYNALLAARARAQRKQELLCDLYHIAHPKVMQLGVRLHLFNVELSDLRKKHTFLPRS